MTETRARAGMDASRAVYPAAEMTAAMAGFLSELKGFQGEVKTALQQQEERLTMLDRKTMTYGRPALAAAADVDVPHKKAFDAYLRSGDDDALRGLPLEGFGPRPDFARFVRECRHQPGGEFRRAVP